MKTFIKAILFALLFSVSPTPSWSQNIIPTLQIVPDSVLNNHEIHVYIMAGQSNMAGRGKVIPQDTIINPRLIIMTKDKKWVYGQEPFHHYEPKLRGLDCGKSFGDYMTAVTPNNVIIAIIPTAIGGSSVDQWLNDDQYRGVQLFSNFKELTTTAMKTGSVKGIIWHQGESDAREGRTEPYSDKLLQLFTNMKQVINNSELPIIVGELGGFWVQYKNPVYAAEINRQLHALSETEKNIGIISTSDLMHKGDSLHFDGSSLRIMGTRYAQKMIEAHYGREEGEIRNQIKKFSGKLMEGDFDQLSKMYTHDAKIFPPGLPILQGTIPILNYWNPPNSQNSKITFHKVDPIAIEVMGNTAIDHGNYYGSSINKEGTTSNWGGKYIIIWKKEGEEWKIEKDIWNRGN